MTKDTPNLVKVVKQIKDGRHKQGRRYSAQTIVWLVIIGTLLGKSNIVCICELFFYNKKLRKIFSKITQEKLDKVPHATTISRALEKMDLESLLKKINNDLKSQNNKSSPLDINTYKKFEKAHDRETTWKITISTDFCSKDLPKGFESVKTIGFIETETKRPFYEKYSGNKKYNTSNHRTYFITSVIKTSKEIFNIERKHWRVEKLHWLKANLLTFLLL
jgi:hypothetical protein